MLLRLVSRLLAGSRLVGSRLVGIRFGGIRFVGTALVLAALASCGGGFSRADAVEAFQASNPDASTVESACVVDALIEGYESEPVNEDDLAGLEAELTAEPPGEAFALDQFRAKFRCGLTDDVERQLRRELEANGALDDAADEAVACVARELAAGLSDDDLNVLINDEITDSFYATFFTAVESCDALPD